MNTEHFGLGDLRQPEKIRKVLEPELERLFQDYTRVWKVVVDMVSGPIGSNNRVEAHRFAVTNPRLCIAPQGSGYTEPRRILLI